VNAAQRPSEHPADGFLVCHALQLSALLCASQECYPQPESDEREASCRAARCILWVDTAC